MSAFTLTDCDDVVARSFQQNFKTADFEIIPRDENNFIFIITTEDEETFYFYAKPGSKIPTIDPILQDFQIDKITPKFYCGKSGLLFFEELNYQKFHRETFTFTVKHFETVLKILAKFHAAGFAHETKSKLKEKYGLEEANFSVKNGEDVIWSLLENEERLSEIIKDLEERQVSSKFRKTLCHGNLSGVNVVFHYENGTPDDCKLINFTTKLYASPVYDVLQLIFFNTNEDFRRTNYEFLLRHYHDQLKEELKIYDLDINTILPIEQMKLASHYLLPLIKLETVLTRNQTSQELKEILLLPRLTREDCYTVVKNKIQSSDFELVSFDTNSLEGGDLKLEVKIRHSLTEETINCFVKCDTKEMFVYDILVPKLHEFGVTIIDNCLPKCYFYRSEDLMVFEDLDRSVSPQNPLDANVLSLVVKKVAQFHASALIFEEKMNGVIEDYDDYFKDDEKSKIGLKSLTDICDLFPEIKIGSKLKKCFPKLKEIFQGDGQRSDRFRNVVSHGGIRPNSIMVQIEDEKPIDCRLIGFQRLKYCPPGRDFLCAMYLTDRATRLKTEDGLKKIYYDELRNILSSYNYKIEKFFSYQEFVDGVESARSQMVLLSLSQKDRLNENILDLSEICNLLLTDL